MVAAESRSTAARSMPESASVPARVCNANWYGRVASSKISANIRARLRDTRRRKVSPVAMSRRNKARKTGESKVSSWQEGKAVRTLEAKGPPETPAGQGKEGQALRGSGRRCYTRGGPLSSSVDRLIRVRSDNGGAGASRRRQGAGSQCRGSSGSEGADAALCSRRATTWQESGSRTRSAPSESAQDAK